MRPIRLSLRRLSRAVLCGTLSSVLLFQPILQAGAQGIVPDGRGGKAPGVVVAPNGVPMVNIQAPNNGLSHNQYQDFNVGSQGLVLNNSANAGRSELGGIVLGNPNLRQGNEARLIINEVTSANRSHLNGFTEVYGRSADVIVSNPNGLTCDGCGFINTPRATLSTGVPVIGADGTLNGLDVDKGDVLISGRGADASRIDAFDIVSRRVTIEAPVSAKNEINIIAGRNQVDYATRAVTAKADDGSTKPTVAIDSRALGGMYAGKISLVSTEKGVGVNTRGDMATHAGQLTLTADGKLVMSGRTSSAGDTSVTSHSSDVVIEQQLGASGKVAVTASKGKATVAAGATVAGDKGVAITAKDIANAGTTQSQSTVDLAAARNVSNEGMIAANLRVTAAGASVSNRGIFQSNGTLSVAGRERVDNTGTMSAAGRFDLSAPVLANGGSLLTDSVFAFNGTQLLNSGTLRFRSDLSLTLTDAFVNAGVIDTSGSLNFAAAGIDNRGTLSAGTGLSLSSIGTLTNGGQIVSNGAVRLTGTDFVNAAGASVQSGGTLSLILSGIFTNAGRLESLADLNISAASINNRADAAVRANGLLDVRSTGGVSNAGLMETAGDLSISATSIGNGAGSMLRANGSVSLRGTNGFANNGTISGLNGLSVTSNGALANGGDLLSGRGLTLSGSRLDNTGRLLADGTLRLNAGDMVNAASGRIQTGDEMQATLWGGAYNAGAWLSAAAFDLSVAGALTNIGTLESGDTLRLSLGGAATNTGLLSAMGSLNATLPSLYNTGALQSGGNLRLSGLGSLYNTETLMALGDLTIEVRDSLSNVRGNILAGNRMELRGLNGGRIGTLQNLSGTIESFDGDMVIAAQSLVNAKVDFALETSRVVTEYKMVWNTMMYEIVYNEETHEDDYIYGNWYTEYFNSLPGHKDDRQSNYYGYIVLVPHPVLGYDFATMYGTDHHNHSIYTIEERTTVVRDSAPGVIAAGRHLSIDAGSLSNQYSTITSAGDMTLSGDTLDNVGATGSYRYWRTSNGRNYTRCFGGEYCEWFDNGGGQQLWIDSGDERYDALIVAGGTLSGSFRDRIDNTVIRERALALPPHSQVLVHEIAPGAMDQRNPENALPPGAEILANASQGWRSDARFTSVANTAASSLFRPAGPNSPYLFESRAQFSSFGHFYGSDYFLSSINFNPDVLMKRLGDAFFDTRLIREEVLRQTGQRWLDGSARNDGDEMKRLIDNGIAASASLGLLPGQAPTAEQLAALDSDMVWYVWQDVGGQKVLGPQLYLAADSARRPEGGAVMAGADVFLSTGTLVNEGSIYSPNILSMRTDADLINRGGSIVGGTVLLSAGRDLVNEAVMTEMGTGRNHNVLLAGLGQIVSKGDTVMSAGRDVVMHGGNVAAGGDLTITATRDVVLDTVEQRNGFENSAKGGYYRISSVNNIGSLLSAEGDVTIAAGRQLGVTGSTILAGNDATLSGKEGVSIGSAIDESHLYSYSSKKSTFKKSSSTRQQDQTTEVGSIISAGNDLKIVSGGDVAIRASALNAGNDLLLAAGAGADGRKDANVTIEAGQNTSFYEQKTKKSGLSFSGNILSGGHSLGYSSTKSVAGQSGTQTVGSQIGAGNNLTILASQDINIAGSQVLAGNDALLSAGRDVNITTVQESSKSWQDTKTSGFGVTIGSKAFAGVTSSKDSVRQDGTYSVGSMISAGNDLTIDAGRNAQISGSWLSAGRDIAISGQQVAIVAADNLQTTQESHKQSQFGVTLGLKGAVGDAITTAYDSAVRMGQTDDSRLKGALAGQAAYNAYKGVTAWNGYNTALVNQAGAQADMAAGMTDDATKKLADGPSAESGLKLSISIGGGSSKSERSTSNSWATGSTLDAGRDVTIVARGGDGVAGNLSIIGSDITAGRDVTLAAKDNILIAAAEQNSKVDGKNSSSGGSIGMSFGVGEGSAGWTIDVAANMGKGKESGSGTTWKESHVTAGDTLTIVSGGDTTIRGGQVSGNTVLADIGGDLTIQSLQDTDKYKSTQTSGSFQVSAGAGGGSGSASFNQDKIKSDYASVTEQSGIYAGSGGFDIYVGGHTQLDGAVIASTADEELNRLDTATLGWSDIDNHAEYSSSSIGGSVSGSVNGSGVFSGGYPVPAIGVGGSGSASGTTQSAVAPGTIVIRDTEHQTQDLASLNRDTSDTLGSIDPIFDKQKVMDQMEASRIFGMVANQIAGDIGTELGWKADGPEKMAIHGLIGALQAGIGGGDMLAGGLAGMGSEFLAAQIGKYLAANPDLSPAQKEAIQQWAAAVGGALVGTAVAGNSSGAQTGAGTAVDSIKYNYLFHAEAEELSALKEKLLTGKCEEKRACTPEEKQALEARIAELNALDSKRDAIVNNACTANPGGSACAKAYAELKDALESYKPHLGQPEGSETGGERTDASNLEDRVRRSIDTHEKIEAMRREIEKMPEAIGHAIENAPENAAKMLLAVNELERANAALLRGDYVEAAGFYALATVYIGMLGTAPTIKAGLSKIGGAIENGIKGGMEYVLTKVTGSEVTAAGKIANASGAARHPLLDDALSRNGERLVLDQGALPTCGHNSCAMLLDTQGVSVDVAALIQKAAPGEKGISATIVANLLKGEGVNAIAWEGRNVADLARYTSNGTPVIVRIASGTGVSDFSHFVVVDGITTRNGISVVAIRDPQGVQYFSPLATFQKSFTGEVVVPR